MTNSRKKRGSLDISETDISELDELSSRIQKLSSSVQGRAASARSQQITAWWTNSGRRNYHRVSRTLKDQMNDSVQQLVPRAPIWLRQRLVSMALSCQMRRLYMDNHRAYLRLGDIPIPPPHLTSTSADEEEGLATPSGYIRGRADGLDSLVLLRPEGAGETEYFPCPYCNFILPQDQASLASWR